MAFESTQRAHLPLEVLQIVRKRQPRNPKIASFKAFYSLAA
jgi:hypothetical protein